MSGQVFSDTGAGYWGEGLILAAVLVVGQKKSTFLCQLSLNDIQEYFFLITVIFF